MLVIGCVVLITVLNGCPGRNVPTVIITDPVEGATGVPVDQRIAVTFSTGMNPLTLTTDTFTLRQGTTPVSGTVSYAGTTATFIPTTSLSPDTTYSAAIAAGVKGANDTSKCLECSGLWLTALTGVAAVGLLFDGNAEPALARDYVWTFTTAAVVHPTVKSTSPANDAVGVPVGSNLAVTFSETMDASTVNGTTFLLRQGPNAVAGTVTVEGASATFVPEINLAPNTVYTATITSGATGSSGLPLASDYVWTFTTGGGDVTAPTVDSTNPANASVEAPTLGKITATFSEAMDPLTITTGTFTLYDGVTPVPGTVTYAGLTATFEPASELASDTLFTATITSGAMDLSGIPLESDYVWTFTTGASA